MAEGLEAERERTRAELERASSLEENARALEDRATAEEPEDDELSQPQQGMVTLLELKDEHEATRTSGKSRGRNGERGGENGNGALAQTLDRTDETVQNLQQSLGTIQDLLAERRRKREAESGNLLQVEVEEPQPETGTESDVTEALDDVGPDDEIVSLREQQTQEQEQERQTQTRSRLRKRLVRLAVVLFAAFVLAPLLGQVLPYGAFAVATESMEPVIPKGSLVTAGSNDVSAGDVIVYDAPTGEFQIHRVVEVHENDGIVSYTTKGDANEMADSFTVLSKDVVGVVDKQVPYLGYAWLVPTAILIGAIVLFVAAYVGIALVDEGVLAGRQATAAQAVAMTFLLLAPSAFAGVGAELAESTDGLGVLDPTPLPMAAGPMGAANVSSDQNSATVTVDAPKLWKEVSMWGCDPTDETGAGCRLTADLTYTTEAGSLTHLDLADYDPAPTFYLEAYMRSGSSTDVSVRLHNATDGTTVAGTEITTTDNSWTLVRSDGFTLSGAKDYQFEAKATDTVSAEVAMVRLISAQPFPVDTATQIRLSGADQRTGGGGWSDSDRGALWQYEDPLFDGSNVQAFFEVVAGGTGDVKLEWGNNNEAATLSFNTGGTGTVERQRSADVLANLGAGSDHHVEVKTQGQDTLNLHLARLVVTQVGFNQTMRYVDLSWTNSTTDTTYQPTGFDGRYHMDSEWGNASARFEASLVNDLSGATSRARLVDNTEGAAVTGSEVSVTGTTVTRARSPYVDLNEVNGTYAAEFKADSGTATVRSAWLLVEQAWGKTYDHVLETTNNAPTCTWSFTLQDPVVTNGTRLANANLSLANATSSQEQIVVENGALVQSSGTPVDVSPSEVLRYTVQTNPTSSGSSTIDARLKGVCSSSGLKTFQDVTFELE